MTYKELLTHESWRAKRSLILIRDKNQCQKCNNERIIQNFQYGLLVYKDEPSCQILVDTFNGEKIQGYCSREAFSIVLYPTIIIFEQQGDFINIIANRTLLGAEVSEYIEKQDKAVDEYFSRNPVSISATSDPNFLKIFEMSLDKVEIPNSDIFWSFFKGLHVHHKYYQKMKLPWEYPETSLQTLCWKCHEDLHKSEQVKFYDEEGQEIGTLTPCIRCHGAGEFPEYNHVQEGICFRCHGAKYEELIEDL